MSRFVKPRKSAEISFAGAPQREPASERLDRIARYVPTEVIAAYLAINGGIASLSSHDSRMLGYGTAFLICLLFTPVYFGKIVKPAPGDPVKIQRVVSTAAFAIWAYALGAGLFKEWDVYVPGMAAALIAVFTLATGLFPAPVVQTDPRSERDQEAR